MPYTYDAYPGDFLAYSSFSAIPMVANFDSNYGSQIPQPHLVVATWANLFVNNHLMDGLHAFWQTGRRLDGASSSGPVDD